MTTRTASLLVLLGEALGARSRVKPIEEHAHNLASWGVPEASIKNVVKGLQKCVVWDFDLGRVTMDVTRDADDSGNVTAVVDPVHGPLQMIAATALVASGAGYGFSFRHRPLCFELDEPGSSGRVKQIKALEEIAPSHDDFSRLTDFPLTIGLATKVLSYRRRWTINTGVRITDSGAMRCFGMLELPNMMRRRTASKKSSLVEAALVTAGFAMITVTAPHERPLMPA